MSAIHFPTLYSATHEIFSKLSPSAPQNFLHEKIPTLLNKSLLEKSWHKRIISHLNRWDIQLDEKIPNFPIQQKIDTLGQYLQQKFSHLSSFNNWLNGNGHGKWYQQLATFLVKLPVRASRNIVQLMYNIVKEALYATVHPLKALNRLAKLIVHLIHALSQPETWSKIGSGIIGASLAQGLITHNPISILGFGIGAAMTVTGLSLGALKAAISADDKWSAAKKNIQSQLVQLPESLLTGFGMGLLIGGIQRFLYNRQMHIQHFANDGHEKYIPQQPLEDVVYIQPVKSLIYPKPPEQTFLSQYGAFSGAVSALNHLKASC